jgi:hypothetical protein
VLKSGCTNCKTKSGDRTDTSLQHQCSTDRCSNFRAQRCAYDIVNAVSAQHNIAALRAGGLPSCHQLEFSSAYTCHQRMRLVCSAGRCNGSPAALPYLLGDASRPAAEGECRMAAAAAATPAVGRGASAGKNTALSPSAQMIGKMMREAPNNSSSPIHKPFRVGRGSNSRPTPYKAT